MPCIIGDHQARREPLKLPAIMRTQTNTRGVFRAAHPEEAAYRRMLGAKRRFAQAACRFAVGVTSGRSSNDEGMPRNGDVFGHTVILSRNATPVREKFVYRRITEPLTTDGGGR